jgi:transcriptional antiterminator RfaH
MSYWSVYQTQPRREALTIRYLANAGIETYLPRIQERERVAPLFPTYVFFIANRWYVVKNCVGVTRILLSGDRPAPVPDAVIAEIRARENRSGLVRLPKPYQIGDQVRVVRGLFANHVGVYAGLTGRQRERVLLAFMNRMVPLELEACDIAAI